MMMVKQFLDYLGLERNYSQRTVEAYCEDLRDFEDFFTDKDSNLSWQTVDADIIRSWMESMMDKGNTATTINRRLSGLRSFYRFALRRGLVERDPAHMVAGPKKNKVLPSFVKEGDMDRLLDPGMWSDGYQDSLARTLLIILYETGIRRSELTGLNVSSVDMASMELTVVGKGSKERRIPFGKEMAEAIEVYMQRREEVLVDDEQALLLTKKGKRMTGEQVRKLVRDALARVTMQKKRSPHVLRHTFATTMLNHQAGLESIKKLLGHESVKTTEIYTHVTFEQLRKVYNAAHPRRVDNNL